MRINHNISALKANNQLAKTNRLLDASLQRLSSGYRINSAADDAAGLAISQKMKTQIAGLNQASRNASDGISVIQTAEGALDEIESMLQRMRELAVQAANGVYTTDDRIAIQEEIDQLNEEITRISENTEFNTLTLLNGNIDRKTFSSNNRVHLISLSDTVLAGNYIIKIKQDARQAVVAGNKIDLGNDSSGNPYTTATRKITADEAGTISVNGVTIQVSEGDTVEKVFEKLRDACDSVNVTVFATDYDQIRSNENPIGTLPDSNNDPELAGYISETLATGSALVFVTKEYGSDQKISVNCSNPDLSRLLGLTVSDVEVYGYDAEAEIVLDSDSLFESTATVSVQGNKITVTDRSNFKMVLEVEPGTLGTTYTDTRITDPENNPESGSISGKESGTDVILTVIDAGPMDLQIGANEGQTMSIRIPRVDPQTLGINKINIGTAEGAEVAVSLLDDAIREVSAIRSRLGAYQNRLEHAISNLDVTSENMTESLSRIEDVDMAEEMAEYTQLNVLAQAGTAMLAQANLRPQQILSLLQQ